MLTAYNQYLTDLSVYFESLQQKAYGDMTDIVSRLSEFEVEQEALWNAWFDSIKGKMDGDIGAKAILMLEEQEKKLEELEEMLVSGKIHAPLSTEDGDALTIENGDMIEAFWYYATK